MKDKTRRHLDLLQRLNESGRIDGFAKGGLIPKSTDPDSVPVLLAPARYAVEDGDTITCNCGASFTHAEHAKRFSWFNHGHAHIVGGDPRGERPE